MLEARARFRRCPGSGDLEIVAYKRSWRVPRRGDARGWADGGAERRAAAAAARGAPREHRRPSASAEGRSTRRPLHPRQPTLPLLTEPTTSPKN
jgi:hypothetical protein